LGYLLYKGLWQRLLSRQSQINWLVEKTETYDLSVSTAACSTLGLSLLWVIVLE
jgi:hypothetical protein